MTTTVRPVARETDSPQERAGSALSVLLIPHWGRRNPYCQLLSGALQMAGARVLEASTGGWFPLFRAVRSKGRPDLVHLQWHHRFFLHEGEGPMRAGVRTTLFFVQVLALRLAGIRLVWTVHNVVNHEEELPGFERRACRLLARLVDVLVVHCKQARRTVSEEYRVDADRIQVVPHGHFGGWYPEVPGRKDARSALGIDEDCRVFLHFGHIRPYKGVEDLLDAFASLGRKDLRLLVAGEARYSWLAQQLTEKGAGDSRVVLDLRFVPDEELMVYLGAADAVVLPYTDSLTSGSAILAASVGRPVVIPRTGCLSEFPESAAVSYEAGRPEGLRDALARAAEAPLDGMGEAAREFVTQFDWAGVGESLVRIYREVGSGGGILQRRVG